jgi:hypothetical protein
MENWVFWLWKPDGLKMASNRRIQKTRIQKTRSDKIGAIKPIP